MYLPPSVHPFSGPLGDHSIDLARHMRMLSDDALFIQLFMYMCIHLHIYIYMYMYLLASVHPFPGLLGDHGADLARHMRMLSNDALFIHLFTYMCIHLYTYIYIHICHLTPFPGLLGDHGADRARRVRMLYVYIHLDSFVHIYMCVYMCMYMSVCVYT